MIYVLNNKIQKVLLIFTFILLSSFSVGYSLLSQSLNIMGNISVLPLQTSTIISSISSGTFTDSAYETSNSSKNGSSATVSVSLPRGNSMASYDITLKNNDNISSRFSSVDVVSSNDSFSYSISGIDTSKILAPGEEIICTIMFYYSNNYKYELPSDTSSSIVIDFNFVSTTRESLQGLTGTISPNSGNVTENEKGALFNISISNPNDFPVTYYFSFAGYTWRILRIDSDSNIRLILNGFIVDESGNVVMKQFKSSNNTSSLSGANTLLRMVNDKNNASVNSMVYGSIDSTDSTTLRGWYNNKLINYENYIVNSTFCFDMSGGHITSSGTNTSVFYYGSYQRIGVDSGIYSPNFECLNEDIFEDKIGLLSSDEYVFAGGAFKVSNSSIFINDFGSSYSWWTLSPAYYDNNLSTVGLFVVPSNGAITDWPNGNTIANSYAIRPVITVNGNLMISGSGSQSDPYSFNNL